MLTEVRKNIKLILKYFRFNLSAVMEYKVSFLTQCLGMMLNNTAFIFFWWILFDKVESIGGYGFLDVMTIWALSSSSFGLCYVVFGNINNLTRMILNGELDSYLLQPKDPLINILCSRTVLSAWGDLFYGIILFAFIKGFSLGSLLLFMQLCITGALLLVSVLITLHTISFYTGNAEGIAQLAVEFMISFSIYPEGVYGRGLRYLFYSLLPVGFISYMPRQLLNDFSAALLFKIFGAALIWVIIAYIAFYRGLRKYESGNLITTKL